MVNDIMKRWRLGSVSKIHSEGQALVLVPEFPSFRFLIDEPSFRVPQIWVEIFLFLPFALFPFFAFPSFFLSFFLSLFSFSKQLRANDSASKELPFLLDVSLWEAHENFMNVKINLVLDQEKNYRKRTSATKLRLRRIITDFIIEQGCYRSRDSGKSGPVREFQTRQGKSGNVRKILKKSEERPLNT